MRQLALLTVVVLLAGCGSYKKDLATICDAPNQAAITATDPSERVTLLAAWIDQRIKTDEARNLFSALANASPNDKSTMLREEAKKNGIASCPLADVFEPAPKPAEPVVLPKAPEAAP